jgi:protein tyrosine/serine phosphatase
MGFNRRTVFTHLLAASIALSPAMGAAATPAAAAANISAVRSAIDNFGQISESYYRGSQPDGADYATLAALGIKTVIDLQADGSPAEKRLVEAAGMTFHRISMTTRTAPTGDQLAEFLEIVSDPANQPVYVHCAGGRHRTGVMTAVYRMTYDGWTADQAFKEMKQYDFGADFLHPEFKRFVYAYRAAPQRV